MAIRVLVFFASYFLVYVAFSSIGFLMPTVAVVFVLSVSYWLEYWKKGIGVELVYWGLAYVGSALSVIGIGLVQSHAGCTFLIGDCYQQTLPPWWFEAKVVIRQFLILLNALALTTSISTSMRALRAN